MMYRMRVEEDVHAALLCYYCCFDVLFNAKGWISIAGLIIDDRITEEVGAVFDVDQLFIERYDVGVEIERRLFADVETELGRFRRLDGNEDQRRF